jgi:hypothetical protein
MALVGTKLKYHWRVSEKSAFNRELPFDRAVGETRLYYKSMKKWMTIIGAFV